jgi:hypothetical protein
MSKVNTNPMNDMLREAGMMLKRHFPMHHDLLA